MLSINKISFKLNKKLILNQVSNVFQANEIIGIIGPPASGKTTLLKAITRSIQPTYGTITINNADIAKFTKPQFNQLTSAYPLNFEYNIDDTVYNFLLDSRSSLKKFWGSLNEFDKQITDEMLNLFQLNDYKNSYLHSVSKTILKKILLAYSFNKDAHILILDDPASGLDIKSIEILYKAIKKYIVKTDKCIIIASHNLNFISQLADRIIIMHQGEFICEGDNNILTELNIRRYFNCSILTSKNVYNGKTEIHFFPET